MYKIKNKEISNPGLISYQNSSILADKLKNRKAGGLITAKKTAGKTGKQNGRLTGNGIQTASMLIRISITK
jgi:hypothetical protein